jgi:hypothetical protein
LRKQFIIFFWQLGILLDSIRWNIHLNIVSKKDIQLDSQQETSNFGDGRNDGLCKHPKEDGE